MFEFATRPRGRRRALLPTVVSAVAHTAVLAALAISALSAAEVLPPPADMMTFVVSAAPPPPPPPAPSPPPRRAETVSKPRARAVRKPPPLAAPPQPVAAAPIEAPVGITPETGFESDALAIEPGFEAGVAGGIVGGIPGGVGPTLGLPPPPAQPVRVGGDISAPRLMQRVNPEYPVMAMQAQIEGVVILEAVVDRRGHVETVKVLRGHPLLEEAATDAVREWRYEPLRLNGQPTPFVLTVTVSFTLG